MIRLALSALLGLFATPARAADITTTTKLVDLDGDGVIVVIRMAAALKIPMGTKVVACGQTGKTYRYALLGRPCDAATRNPLLGVNLSGLEAGRYGALGYTHVAPTRADIDLAYASGMRLFRIPMKAYRVQPQIMGDLDPTERDAVWGAVDYVLSKPDAVAVVDDHSFGSRLGAHFGTAPWTPDAIVDFGSKVLARYKGNSRVMFDIQNEPHVLSVPEWQAAALAVTKGLRAAGYTNTLWLEGAGYSSAASWLTNNGPWAATFPDKNVIFSPHTYFDWNSSGTKPGCVAGSEKRVLPPIQHAEANHYRIAFGEIAFSADASCDAVRASVVKALKASQAVYGVTFWTMGNFAMHPAYLYGLTGRRDPTTNKLVGKGEPSALLNKLLETWNRSP